MVTTTLAAVRLWIASPKAREADCGALVAGDLRILAEYHLPRSQAQLLLLGESHHWLHLERIYSLAGLNGNLQQRHDNSCGCSSMRAAWSLQLPDTH